MTSPTQTCPDCEKDGARPTGQRGTYRDGSPMTCWTCNGSGQIPVIVDATLERAVYEESCQESIYANDGDTWLDNSPYAVALRAAIPTRLDKVRAAVRRAEGRRA